MIRHPWQSLPFALRWLLLLGLFAATCAVTAILRWGTLPATPFYPVVLISIVLGTERQGYVLTALSVATSLVLAPLLHVAASPSDVALNSALLLVVAATLIVTMTQRRAAEGLTKQAMYESGVIRAVGNFALTRLSREDMMRAVVRHLANSTDASMALVVMPDPDENYLTGYIDANGSGYGPQIIEREIAYSLAGDIFESGQAVLVPDTTKQPNYMSVPGIDIGSLVGVPLLLDGHPIGVLSVGKKQLNGFSHEDVRLLETLSRTLSVPLYASRPARRERRAATES